MIKQNQKIGKEEDIMLSLKTVSDIKPPQIDDLIQRFNAFGCVLITCDPTSDLRQDLLALHSIFGPAMFHRSSDVDGVVTITPVEGATYTALTTGAFTFHTDGCFMPEPPKVFALQCEVASKTGGLSLIIQAESVFQYLQKEDPKGLEALFDVDAMSISTVDKETTQGPVFSSENGLIRITYRSSDHQVTITPKPSAQRAFQLLTDYVETSTNQFVFKLKPHQTLVLDNTRLLHNRTPFPVGEIPKRKLHRLWFNGESAFSPQIHYGFAAA